MLFGVLSAIALGIGITATVQDLSNQVPATQQSEPVIQVQEIPQNKGESDR